MPSDHSDPQRATAWPEVPPAWPEVPTASSFTPTVRSFVESGPPMTETGPFMTGAGPSMMGATPQAPAQPFEAPGQPFPNPAQPFPQQPAQPFQGPAQPFPNPAQPFPQQPAQPFANPAQPFANPAQPFSPQPVQAQPSPPRADDPYKPFVTAGQISGPKTPPAHRQQELWNTVFGENYRAIDEYEDEERGRPIWLFTLVGTVLVALVGGLIWAFVAGPLRSDDGAETVPSPEAKPTVSAAPPKAASQFPALPRFKGTASPVSGVVTDEAAGITVPKLGGPWQLDRNAQDIKTKYGYATRQFVPAGMTTRGKPEFAQVMSGPLPQPLAARYTSPDKLAPVISAVMFQARQTLFPKGNKVTKVAQQRLSRNGLTGLIAAYKVEADKEETTVFVGAVNTGADVPAIVYMAVPALKDDLLPDINTVFKAIRRAG
ncbi:hypothetical protein N5079_12730 [Planotetraspora sp. A-T 1434]|uniref:hypothetical protein n=1 Tax=Planotetraspora sp. A-T 1434 TaxID=2979219 RepID=UPI0021BE962B|nr:hypothetical protein [Planotetraspora sp. A-T 1434]MCT9931081.1 hypothetical protein [Planotetraspora sp. A-T 1434]